jgi:hypothetical protein
MPAPLLDLAMSFVRLASPSVSDASLTAIRAAFDRFLSDALSRPHLAGVLESTIGTLQPLERLEPILMVGEQPPPRRDCAVSSAGGRRQPRPWSAYEDTRLYAGVHRFGLENWGAVAGFVGNGRSRGQCSQRWIRGLDPRISKEAWSPEDDERLLALVRAKGTKMWMQVAAEIGNRSDVQCRYHFLQLQREGRIQEVQPLEQGETESKTPMGGDWPFNLVPGEGGIAEWY